MRHQYRVGDKVVYTREMYSSRPSAGAKNVQADRKGEAYHYQVEKYWVVLRVLSGDLIEVCTRSDNRHIVPADDIRLRPASWLERLLKSRRFPIADALPNLPLNKDGI